MYAILRIHFQKYLLSTTQLLFKLIFKSVKYSAVLLENGIDLWKAFSRPFLILQRRDEKVHKHRYPISPCSYLPLDIWRWLEPHLNASISLSTFCASPCTRIWALNLPQSLIQLHPREIHLIHHTAIKKKEQTENERGRESVFRKTRY